MSGGRISMQLEKLGQFRAGGDAANDKTVDFHHAGAARRRGEDFDNGAATGELEPDVFVIGIEGETRIRGCEGPRRG